MLGASSDEVTQVQSQGEPGTEQLFREGWAQRTSRWAAASQLCFSQPRRSAHQSSYFFLSGINQNLKGGNPVQNYCKVLANSHSQRFTCSEITPFINSGLSKSCLVQIHFRNLLLFDF